LVAHVLDPIDTRGMTLESRFELTERLRQVYLEHAPPATTITVPSNSSKNNGPIT